MKFGKLSWMFDERKRATTKWGKLGSIIIQTKQEARLLYKMSEKFCNSTIVELGRKYGGSTVVMAAAINRQNGTGHIYSIDITDDHYQTAKDFIKSMKMDSYITLIKGNTQDYPNDHTIKDAGFVFFDASHDFDSINKEFNTWFPVIQINGFMIVHDYNMDKHPGITKAVNKFLKEKPVKLIERVNRSALIQKLE